MTRPPVFGKRKKDRWSIGSEVVAFWWIEYVDEDGDEIRTEVHDVAVVGRLFLEGEVWMAEVTWGPLLDLARPTTYLASELVRAAPYDP